MSLAMMRKRLAADSTLPLSSLAIAAPFQGRARLRPGHSLAIHCAEVDPASAARKEYTRSHLGCPSQIMESRGFSLIDHRGRHLFRRFAARHGLGHDQLPRLDANLGEVESEPHRRA